MRRYIALPTVTHTHTQTPTRIANSQTANGKSTQTARVSENIYKATRHHHSPNNIIYTITIVYNAMHNDRETIHIWIWKYNTHNTQGIRRAAYSKYIVWMKNDNIRYIAMTNAMQFNSKQMRKRAFCVTTQIVCARFSLRCRLYIMLSSSPNNNKNNHITLCLFSRTLHTDQMPLPAKHTKYPKL